MISRGTLIAGLLVVELVILGEAVVAIRGGGTPWGGSERADARTASGSRLPEDGPHRVFAAGAHPALNVDIGYADLTIRAGRAGQIDVSVSASSMAGMFRATAPITARADGEAVLIAAADQHGISVGDDRMVTVLVPPQTQVTVVHAGDIKATGLRAEASFKSVGEGSVTVEDYDAPALDVTSAGRVVLHDIVADRLDATSSDDRVEGTALQVRDGSIESDERVSLGFAAGADTLVHAEASDGKISLSGFAAGAVPAAATKSDDDEDSSSQTVRIGAGKGHFDVHAHDGNITLSQDG